ncbi:unnamed protein product [Dovyalis caffra]|uniref:Transcription factor CBF/NF-Y/archaeal histone domain-containing protein n=1 Tax=Dovyalis caffra TaxID=77055 RepID=A0AAV1RHG2_9ROSI|nr:unnamed protein product [Dovyalis caffra]
MKDSNKECGESSLGTKTSDELEDGERETEQIRRDEMGNKERGEVEEEMNKGDEHIYGERERGKKLVPTIHKIPSSHLPIEFTFSDGRSRGEQGRKTTTRPEFPTGRIKRIMKLDKDINKVNSDALFLVSSSTELFVRFLAEKSAEVAVEKKRKIVKLDHIRVAVKRHQPTSDFLLDSLPLPIQSSEKPASDKISTRTTEDKPAPAGTRRIDHFFTKAANEELPVQINES